MRRLQPIAFLLVFAAVAAPFSRSARVENGLRPAVLIEGDKTWTLEERMRLYKVPGVSVAVIKDFRIDWAKGYGFADVAGKRVTEETLFQAGSISKPVAAMGALKVVEAGKLSLDSDINTVLRSWKLPENELTRKSPVTLERLLSHTAGVTVHGFPGYAADEKVPTLLEVLDGSPPANTAPLRVDLTPGTQYRYSGGGYTIAQQAMIDVAGKPFPRLLAETVLAPVGMTRSTYEQPLDPERMKAAAAGYRPDGSEVPGKRHVYPEMAAAGLWTTPSDLARFAIAIQKCVRGKRCPLSQAMIEDMLTPRKEGYGLGLTIERRGGAEYFTHGGADEGFQALLYAHKTKGYGAVIMTNSDAGFRVMPELLRSIATEYRWEGFVREPERLAKLSPQELSPLSGRFRLDEDSVVVFTPKDGRLEAHQTLQSDFELLPISADTFVRRDEETRYMFGKSPDETLQLRIVALDGTEKNVPRLADEVRVPSESIEAGRIGEALAAYRKLREANPSNPVVSETRFNQLGYGLLGRKETAKAIAVLRFNTELYPDSANTWDSLAEAYEGSGDKERAIELYRKALDLISRGLRSSAIENQVVRTHAVARLKALGVEP
jgi:CubicO group peptidase (beta-lactamase class C family)